MYVPPPPTLSIDSRCAHRFRVMPLCRIGRWFREVGYTAPLLANDRAFDDRWSLEACDRDFGEALARDREARAAIETLSELGCTSLAHTGRKLSAELTRRQPPRKDRPENDRHVRDQLSRLDRSIARLCSHRTFDHEGGRGRFVTAVVILALAFAGGAACLALDANELLDRQLEGLALRSFLFSVPLALVVIAAMLLLLAGRSTSHKELGVVAALALVGLPVLGVGAAVTINRVLDDGAATMHRLPVLEVQNRRSESSKHPACAIISDWDSTRGETLRVRLNREQAAAAAPGTTWLTLTTSPGRLGAERLLSLRIENAEAH